MSRKCFIYALCEPDTGEFKYVGQTISLENRMQGHITGCLDGYLGKSKKAQWVKSLLEQDKLPELFVLEEVAWELADDREKYWIDKMRSHGYDLTNGKWYIPRKAAATFNKKVKATSSEQY